MEQADQLEINQLAFEARYIHPLRNMHDQLKTLKFQQTQSWKQIVSQNKKYQQAQEKARMYLSHFVQVLNMSIDREELTPETRRFYGIDPGENKIPRMISATELLEWGRNIIDGETKRIRTGGAPIMSPTIGKVRVWYDKFRDLHHSQEVARKSYQRSVKQLPDVRRKTDALIQMVWNQIEEHYEQLPEEQKRTQSMQYGIVYIFRKNENPTSTAPSA